MLRALGVAAFFLAQPCLAQEDGGGGEQAASATLSIELNSVLQGDGLCRVTMIAENGLGADLDGLVLETVLLTVDGIVDRLTLFDFQALPQGRPRVRQFDIPGMDCADLGQILINGIETCGADDARICTDGLDLSSRSDDVELIG